MEVRVKETYDLTGLTAEQVNVIAAGLNLLADFRNRQVADPIEAAIRRATVER